VSKTPAETTAHPDIPGFMKGGDLPLLEIGRRQHISITLSALVVTVSGLPIKCRGPHQVSLQAAQVAYQRNRMAHRLRRSFRQAAQTSPPSQVCQPSSRHLQERIRNRISSRTAPIMFGFSNTVSEVCPVDRLTK
jgi:hypothetical protein